MAFLQRNLRQIGESYPRFWSYWTDDTATKVKERGYFEPAKERFGSGDWIFATTSTGGVFLHVDETDPLELGDPR